MVSITIHLTQEQILSLSRNEDVVITVGGESVQSAAVQTPAPDFFEFFDGQIREKADRGCDRTSEIYRLVYNRLKRFLGDKKLTADQVTVQLMDDYGAYLMTHGLIKNTVSFHMRVLRAVYNRAVDLGMTIDRRPFRHVYTGVDKTVKRAISADAIRAISRLELEEGSVQAFARDLFLFSFFTRGMALVDLAYLKPSDIKDGRLTYIRRKTRQSISLLWEQPMQEIVDRYRKPGQPYLLPIICKLNGKERSQLHYWQGKINSCLHQLGKAVGLECNLTMYVARHSWASIARQVGISLALISLGMGHTSEDTTQVYLKTMDMSPLDAANLQLIQLVWGNGKKPAQQDQQDGSHEEREPEEIK